MIASLENLKERKGKVIIEKIKVLLTKDDITYSRIKELIMP